MNYRHAYHAGNHGDCLKHALLVWLITAMQRKDTPLTVLDTHAGAGAYDLAAPESQATGEAQSGILRLRDAPPAPLAAYVALTAGATYPGSPELARRLLRPQDRLVCCELHAADAAALKRHFAHDRQVAVHHRCGFQALTALLPPATPRGLILIDPPYERADDAARAIEGLAAAAARFRAGVYALWLPLKHLAPVRQLRLAVEARLRDVVAATLWLRPPTDPARLNGSLLAVMNPPFGFEAAADARLEALAARLGEAGAGHAIERWAAE